LRKRHDHHIAAIRVDATRPGNPFRATRLPRHSRDRKGGRHTTPRPPPHRRPTRRRPLRTGLDSTARGHAVHVTAHIRDPVRHTGGGPERPAGGAFCDAIKPLVGAAFLDPAALVRIGTEGKKSIHHEIQAAAGVVRLFAELARENPKGARSAQSLKEEVERARARCHEFNYYSNP
jgi:hypothetical protein